MISKHVNYCETRLYKHFGKNDKVGRKFIYAHEYMLDGMWLSIHYLSMFIISVWFCETHVYVGNCETVLKYQGNTIYKSKIISKYIKFKSCIGRVGD